MTTEDVSKILMRRDEISHEEAMSMIRECAEAIEDSGYDPFEVDQIMMDHLGLEPDYIIAVLDVLECKAK